MTKWVILTGEYPPQPVSDYTRQVAQGLAGAGDAVFVWAPETKESALKDHGVTVLLKRIRNMSSSEYQDLVAETAL
jgi:hypothetical protein